METCPAMKDGNSMTCKADISRRRLDTGYNWPGTDNQTAFMPSSWLTLFREEWQMVAYVESHRSYSR
jgi:hypothetical protein